MKRNKLIASAIVVFAVAGAVAFKAKSFSPANVWCFPQGQSITTNEDCNLQSNGQNVFYETVSGGTGTTTTPCETSPTTYVPYLQGTNSCTAAPVGQLFLSTAGGE